MKRRGTVERTDQYRGLLRARPALERELTTRNDGQLPIERDSAGLLRRIIKRTKVML